MGIIDKIKGNPFEKLKKDDLTANRIQLEREEKLKIGEVERMSKQKKELFDRGFEASEGERRSLATKIERFDRNIKLGNMHLRTINKDLRVVDNLIFAHESKEMLERGGLLPKLAKMPLSDLKKFLAEVNLKERVRGGNLNGIFETIEAEYGIMDEIAEDAETTRLMDIWETSDITESDEIYKKLDQEKGEKGQLDELEL